MLHTTLRRCLPLALAFCFLASVGESVLAQEARTRCGYDTLSPSLEHASERYGAYDFYCSVREILDFVAIDTITSERRAGGYRLLSMVMYDSLLYTDQEGIKAAVIDAGKQAWKADPEWVGEYEIDAADYIDWMSEARNLALDELEQERVQAQAEHQSEEDLSQPTLSMPIERRSGRRTEKILTGIACAAATSVMVATHFSANGKFNEYEKSRNPEELPSLWSSYESRWKLRNTAGIIAVALAALEAYWFLSSSSDSESNGSYGLRIGAGFGISSSCDCVVLTYEF